MEEQACLSLLVKPGLLRLENSLLKQNTACKGTKA